MKLSAFNVDLPLDSFDGNRVVYNTFTDSTCIWTPELDQVAQRACRGMELSKDERQAVEELAELGFLVPQGVNEDRELEYWFQKVKFDSSVFQVTLLPTYDCNLRCTYCFESDVLQPLTMSPAVVEQALEWIDKMLHASRPRTMLLTFFGGEPLMHWEAVELTCWGTAELVKARNIALELQVITNGVLLSEEQIDFLQDIGPTQLKVTLDGDEAAHNAKRPFSDGGGTFRTIINNLLAVLGKVDLVIGGNFDATNLASIPKLLDYLRSLGFDETNCSFSFKPIMAAPGGESVCTPCTYSDTKVEDILWAVMETERRGMKALRKTALQPCEALREWSFTIDPLGQLYKCPAMVGRTEGIVGDITSETLNYTNTMFMTADHWKKCGRCSLRPICNGGCGYSAFIKHGDYQGIACERRYIEKVGLELIKDECLEAITSLRAR